MHRLRLAVGPAYLLLCLLLGGASAAGGWANLVLQILGLAIILWSVLARPATPLSAGARGGIAVLLLIFALFAVEIVPLPPALWSHLPGRAPVADGFRMLGLPLPWLPLSLEPYRTLASAFWLIPAAAVYLATVRLGAFRASWFAWVLAAVTLFSVTIGALQVASGAESGWYLYRVTNIGQMVGFFANANHFATLLVATIPFLAALYLSARAGRGSVQKSSALLVILVGTLLVVFVGIGVNTSLAGIGLSVPVLGASLLMLYARKRRPPVWAPVLIALVLAGSVAAVMSAPFENNLTAAKAGDEDSRRLAYGRTLAAARDYFPVGSGIGTFQQVYRQHEDPAKTDATYMNHAHSDYVELALEAGLPGYALLAVFLWWWVRRTAAAWRPQDPDVYARAATIATAAMLAHSLVDYPLRTAALGAVFAMGCGLMSEARTHTRRRADTGADPDAPRHLSAD
ncbi:MAG: O-antigen ligase family protein [Allosphingosinicella sp.]